MTNEATTNEFKQETEKLQRLRAGKEVIEALGGGLGNLVAIFVASLVLCWVWNWLAPGRPIDILHALGTVWLIRFFLGWK